MTRTPPPPAPLDETAIRARRRTRNWVLAGLLIAWVALIYAISIARMGGAG